MQKISALTFAWLSLLFATTTCAQAVSVEDFAGRRVELAAPAQRIVALAPHLVENLYSAGAGDKLVGVVSYSDYPPQAGDIPEVGSFNAYSLEAIASLQPDLILMWGSGNGMRTLARLEVLGIPVFVSEPRQLADIARDIRLLGQLAGNEASAEREAARLDNALAELRQRYSGGEPIPVMYEIWNQPLQTINGEHLISQVIGLCGGHNIFAELTSLAPQVNIEAVLARSPRAIVASGRQDTRPDWLDEWRRYPDLPAVRDGGLFFVDPDLLERPTARVLQGARSLCSQLDKLRSDEAEQEGRE
jgi:iron complex transport system substrate-binding protein